MNHTTPTPNPTPKSRSKPAADRIGASDSQARGFWKGRGGLIMPAILVAIAIYLSVGIAQMAVPDDRALFGPKIFPMITIGLLLVVALILTIDILRNPEQPTRIGEDLSSNWRSVGIVVGTLVLFIALLETAGWIIAAAVLFTGVALGLGSTRYGLLIGVGFAISSSIQLIFVGLLGLSLPAGVFGRF